MIVNLWDSNFDGQSCSVFGKESKHVQYVHKQMNWDGVTVFTDAWINNPVVDQVSSRYKVGWLHEPQCLHPDIYEQAYYNRGKFAFTMTYYQDFLNTDPTWFRFAPYAGVWIKRDKWGMRPKTKLVSMLYGSKMSTDGHRIRHEIADFLGDSYGVDYYGYRGEPTDYSADTKLRVLGDYAFSIVTETCRQDNLFTEILLDCFAVGTIPIFWGCPNVYDHFDRYGVLSFESVDEVAYLLMNWANMRTYSGLTPHIENNLDVVGEYEITEDWMYENILKELE